MENLKDFCLPKGFLAAGEHIGLKKVKKDLSLIVSEKDCSFAGCFTQNKVKAAPVLWDMEILKKKKAVKALITNSGNANACTGEQGKEDVLSTAKALSKLVKCEPENVLVFSTGVIGVPLPVEKLLTGIENVYPTLGKSNEHALNAAQAIMTTDTFEKTVSIKVKLGGKEVVVSGMSKGSGMIHPNMATMLAYVLTDANISSSLLQKALSGSTENTYNMISVDGDSSTNDSIVVVANGMAENALIETENEDYFVFKEALEHVNKCLSKLIVKDGEGATKTMEVTVKNAKSLEDARKIAKSVVSSSLFKAALFGADANWGRVLCAMGYSEGEFDVDNVCIYFKSLKSQNDFQTIMLMDKSVPVAFSEETAKEILSRSEIFIDIVLNDGDFSATAWGCDLTYDYVKINGDYRS